MQINNYLSGEIIFLQKIMRNLTRNEIAVFGNLLTKRDSKRERYVQNPAFQTRKKETMEGGGRTEQNKADLPMFLTERKTKRERYGTCERTMRKRDGGGTDIIRSAEGRRSPEESLHRAAIDAFPQGWL